MKTIVITGSAASGKSKIIRRLAYTLTNKGFATFVLPETATELLEAGFDSLSNKMQFQTTLFDLQLEKEIYRNHIENLYDKNTVLLLDRGLADGAVYIEPNDFEEIIRRHNLTVQGILQRYDSVIQLQPCVMVCELSKKRREGLHETNNLQSIYHHTSCNDFLYFHRAVRILCAGNRFLYGNMVIENTDSYDYGSMALLLSF